MTPQYQKKYYETHKEEICAKKREKYKDQKRKERARSYSKKYYQTHKEEIKMKNREKWAMKKAFQETIKSPDNKDTVYYTDLQKAATPQLARIEKVLWWIAFAISFVGVAVLFK